eukprot:5978488-Amphidinium_carterae.1
MDGSLGTSFGTCNRSVVTAWMLRNLQTGLANLNARMLLWSHCCASSGSSGSPSSWIACETRTRSDCSLQPGYHVDHFGVAFVTFTK